MRPLSALLVALLFVAAAVTPVAALTADRPASIDSTHQSITPLNNTTNQLAIPDSEVSRSTYSDIGVDVGTAVQTGSAQLHQRHDALAFEARFERADSNAARNRLVNEQLAAVETQQAELDARQDRAMRQYAVGTISAAEFLRVRMVVNAEAAELLSTLRSIDSAPDSEPGYALSAAATSQLRTVEGELQTLNGPVGDRLRADAAGASERSVYLEVSNGAYMLAASDGEKYLRETRLDYQRSASLPDQFLAAARNDSDTRFSAADERASELYTWLYERQRPSFTYYGTSGIYELTATHPNGQLTAYIDAGTTNVFYEEQTRDLSGIETTSTETGVNGSLRVTVQRSVETGPLLVSATRNTTGDAVDATVSINGQRVGSTGDDGFLWTVEPSGDYTVNVTAADERTVLDIADV